MRNAAHDLAGAETLFHAMHSQIARPLSNCGAAAPLDFFGFAGFFDLPAWLARAGLRRRLDVGQHARQFHARHRRIAGDRRRIAHRALQHVADGIAERGDVLARARKSGPGLRLAGRRRNMPSKSTIPASLSLSGDPAQMPAGQFDSPSRTLNEWMSLAQRTHRLSHRAAARPRYRLAPPASTSRGPANTQPIDFASVSLRDKGRHARRRRPWCPGADAAAPGPASG